MIGSTESVKKHIEAIIKLFPDMPPEVKKQCVNDIAEMTMLQAAIKMIQDHKRLKDT